MSTENTKLDLDHKEKMIKIHKVKAKIMAEKTVEKGLVIVHTGAGKGKSTAAMGMAMRMMGHGMKVSIIQFIKGAMNTGEQAIFDAFPDLVEMRPMGEGFTWDTQDRSRDMANVRAAWEVCKSRIMDPDWKMVICDELNIALRYDYLPLAEVLEALAAKPHDTHVVITGRNAKEELIAVADLVTEMTLVKHPFRSGIKDRKSVV